MAIGIPAVIALTSAASGVAQYMGAAQTARVQKSNADAIEQQAEAQAIVDLQNAQDQRQQLDYKIAETKANNFTNLIKKQETLNLFNKQLTQATASTSLKLGYGGTSGAIIDALEDEAWNKQTYGMADMDEASLASSLQIGEFGRQSRAVTKLGQIQSQNTLTAGRNKADNMRAAASATRTAGMASMLGSFASGASGYASAAAAPVAQTTPVGYGTVLKYP
jgi:hypothetical protein